ncbi:MFS transporter [Citricoccus zhacaiensis]|nr:MFS transporter [Citricoccus zhacaiensis]
MFTVAWGGNQFTPLLSMYRAENGFSDVTVNTLLFAYVVGLVPSLLLASAAAKRFGLKPMLVAALPMSALGSALLILGSTAPAVMFLGRTLIGLALGIGMVVGGLALKQLSLATATAPSEPLLGDQRTTARAPSAPRSSAMSLTAGFALGAGLAGVVAQWLPHPTALPYVLHLLVCLAAALGLFWLRLSGRDDDIGAHPLPQTRRLPAAYLLGVLPAAPWIFGALGIAYAILPSVVSSQLTGLSTAFSALLCLISLGIGFAAQQMVAHFTGRWRFPARPVGVGLFVVGTAMGIVATISASVVLVVLAAIVLGIGYGLILVGCLQDCDRLAGPGQLGQMTGVVYTLGYLGFGLPMVVAWIQETFGTSYPVMLAWIAGIALVSNLAGALAIRVVRHRHR